MSNDRIAFGQEVYRYFLDKGLPPHQAAAIAGNMAWEGGGKANLVNPGDNYRNSPRAPHSIGIGQWNDRSPALVDYARRQGIDIPQGDLRDRRYAQDVINRIPLQTQLGFAHEEMQGPEARAYRNITSAPDLTTATAGAIGYHRPAGWTLRNPYAGHGFSGRQALASQILQSDPQRTAPQAVSSADTFWTPEFNRRPTYGLTQPPLPPRSVSSTPMALGLKPSDEQRETGDPISTPEAREREFDAAGLFADMSRQGFAGGGAAVADRESDNVLDVRDETAAQAYADREARERAQARARNPSLLENLKTNFERSFKSRQNILPAPKAKGGAVMPLIKSGSNAAVGNNISEMEKAGHPRAQAIAAALSTARRYGKAGGGPVAGGHPFGMRGKHLPGMPPPMPKVAGLPPKPPGMRAIPGMWEGGDPDSIAPELTRDILPTKPHVSEHLGTLNAMMRAKRDEEANADALPEPRDLTTEDLVADLPAAARRSRFIEQFGRSPEDTSVLGNTGSYLRNEALPTVLGAAVPMLPKKIIVPAIAGLAGTIMSPDRSEAAEKGKKGPAIPASETLPKLPGTSVAGDLPSAVANDSTIKTLIQQIKEQRAIADSPVHPNMSKVTREAAIARADALQDKLNSRIAELTKASAPWRQAHPDWASAWPAIQVGAPMVAGYLAKNMADLGVRARNAPWNKAVNAAEEALFPPVGKPNVMRGEYETDKALGYKKSRGNEPSPLWSGVREHGVPAIAGGAAGVEAAMFPYQFDARNAPIGSKEQEEAQARLDDPLGTAWKWGALGALTGWASPHIAPTIGPGRHPGPETEALQKYLAGLKSPGPGPSGPSGGGPAALTAGASNSPASTALVPASSPTSPVPAPANSAIDLPLMRESTAPWRWKLSSKPIEIPQAKAGQLPAPEAAASRPMKALPAPTAEGAPPKWATDAPPNAPALRKGEHWIIKKDGTYAIKHEDTGHFRDVPSYRAPKAEPKAAPSKSQGNEKATDAKKAIGPEDEAYWNDKLTKGQKDGGSIASALETARKYAKGGVVVGPVVGATGGRTDALPVDVPSGSFVVPADCVSALGEGNTGAGVKALDKMLGKQAKAGAHSRVPIKISDGEYVVAPATVAHLGRGDMNQGHKVLDALVLRIRKHHIETLKALPPPHS